MHVDIMGRRGLRHNDRIEMSKGARMVRRAHEIIARDLVVVRLGKRVGNASCAKVRPLSKGLGDGRHGGRIGGEQMLFAVAWWVGGFQIH